MMKITTTYLLVGALCCTIAIGGWAAIFHIVKPDVHLSSEEFAELTPNEVCPEALGLLPWVMHKTLCVAYGQDAPRHAGCTCGLSAKQNILFAPADKEFWASYERKRRAHFPKGSDMATQGQPITTRHVKLTGDNRITEHEGSTLLLGLDLLLIEGPMPDDAPRIDKAALTRVKKKVLLGMPNVRPAP